MPINKTDRQIAVIGAGPFGLAVSAALKQSGADVALFGRVMSFWKEYVPQGMTLLSGPIGLSEFTRDRFAMPQYEKGLPAALGLPISADDFASYGCWYHENACPEADPRQVTNLRHEGKGFQLVLEDGTQIGANKVVLAVGMKPFAYKPVQFAAIGAEHVSHTSELCSLQAFRDRRVIVIGSSQSALETASLLAERGALVEIVARAPQLPWRPTGHLEWSSRTPPSGLAAVLDFPRATLRRWLDDPDFFRHLPRLLRARLLQRTLRSAASGLLKPRLEPVRLALGRKVSSASVHGAQVELTLDDGSCHTADHVVLGTGFKIQLNRLEFVNPELRARIAQNDGYPTLNRWMECSVPGLYFAGVAAAGTFGPLMWFVRSAPWAAQRISLAISR